METFTGKVHVLLNMRVEVLFEVIANRAMIVKKKSTLSTFNPELF